MDLFIRYKVAVQHSVGMLAEEFRRCPESYLYESDLQARLFGLLFADLADCPVVRSAEPYWRASCGRETLKINPVKSEYPDGTWFDIALLEPPAPSDPSRNVWNLSVRLALEVKFRQANGGGPGIEDDLGKMRRYAEAKGQAAFTGISLLFCHRPDDEQLGDWCERHRLVLDPTTFEPPETGIVAWAVTSKGGG